MDSFSDQDRAVLIDDLALYDRFCLPEKVQRVMAWTPGSTITSKYSLRKKYAHILVTGRQTHGRRLGVHLSLIVV